MEKPEWIRENPIASRLLESPETLSSFIEKVIKSPDGKGGLRLAPYQLDFVYKVLHRVWEGRNMFIFKSSRQVGKTTSASIVGLLMAIIYPNEDVIIVSPRQEQSEIMFRRIKSYVESNTYLYNLVDWGKPFRQDRMHFKNGSLIRALSVGKPERILGHSASTLIVDESAEIPDEVYYQYLLPVLVAPRNRLPQVLVEISTPHKINHFYEAWNSDDYVHFTATVWDAVKHGFVRREFIERIRAMTPEDKFRVWYEAEFPSGSSRVYPYELVSRSMTLDKMWGRYRGGYRYFMGVDIAVTRGDCSAYSIIAVPEDQTDPHQAMFMVVRVEERCGARAPTVVNWVSKWANAFKVEAIGIDYIGVGITVAQYLEQSIDKPIYKIRLTGEKRLEAYEFVRRLMEEERIVLPKKDDLQRQFDSFYYDDTSSGRGYTVKKKKGARDDMADAVVYGVWTAYNRMRGRVVLGEPIKLDWW